MNDAIQPIVLAGGKGTRLKSALPKPLFALQGKAMVRHVIEAIEADHGCLSPIVVIGHGGEQVKAELGPKYRYARQQELTGTATAVEAALPLLGDEPTLVLYGDNPLISTQSIRRLRQAYIKTRPTIAMYSVTLPDFKGWRGAFVAFGRVKRDQEDKVIGIIEYKHATEEEKAILEVTPGGNCFDSAWLRQTLPQVEPDPNTGERYLTSLVEIAESEGREVMTVSIPAEEALGINSLYDAELVRIKLGE